MPRKPFHIIKGTKALTDPTGLFCFAITREEFPIANDANHTSLALAELMVQLNHTCPDMYQKSITITPPDDLKIAWLCLSNRSFCLATSLF
jgi:hypothetical protein